MSFRKLSTTEQKRADDLSAFRAIDRKLTMRSASEDIKPQGRVTSKTSELAKLQAKQDLSWREKQRLKALQKHAGGEQARQIELKRRREAPLPKWMTDFTGKVATYGPVKNKIIQNVFETDGSVTKNRAALTSFSNYVFREVKRNPEKIAQTATFPAALRVATASATRYGLTKLVTKVPHGQLIAKRTVQVVCAGLGVAYSVNVHSRITEDVFTGGYSDGKSTTTKKKLPNGDIEETTSIEQIPIYRRPTRQEQVERTGGIFATELLPLGISHRVFNRGITGGYKKPPTTKPKVKTTTKIRRAGEVIKTTPAKIRTLPKKIKTKAQKAKELKDIKKRHEKAEKDIIAKEKARKIVKLSDSTYNKISKLSKLKAKLEALATKIRNIPAAVAKRIGLNKTKEIQKINILMRETDAVRSYIIMIQKGTSRKVVVAHLSKLSKTKLQVIDTKTGKTIKNIESTTKGIELKIKPSEKIDFKVTKPGGKPSTEYIEVKGSDGMVQLQKVKVIQKSVTETIKITKADVKAVEMANAEAKAILKTKPKTQAAVRTKHRNLQKVNTKIKTKQKQLLIYRRQLMEAKPKLKHRQTILIALVDKMKPAEKTRTKRIILTIPRYIELIDHAVAQITKTTVLVAPVIIPAAEIIPKPRIRITPIHKPIPIKVPIPIKPVLLLPKKTPTKKKKKRKKKGVKEAFVKNPVPSLKAFLG